jgi:uncharacterized protein
MGNAAIGFSGGVDSTFLVKIARDVLGSRVIAITVDTPFIPRSELDEARNLAQMLQVQHHIVTFDIFQYPEIMHNSRDRCYYCKLQMYRTILDVAHQQGIDNVLDASNVDDLQDYRPGWRALQELAIISPLVEEQFTKQEIRLLSQQFHLPTSEKPANACLASRIPYGQSLSKDTLRMVEKAEEVVHSFGIKGPLRVRCHDSLARIEVMKPDVQRVLDNAEVIVKRFKDLGFTFVTLDIEGYRTGSLNEVL